MQPNRKGAEERDAAGTEAATAFGCSDCFESGISRKGFCVEAKASNPRLPSPAVTTRFPSMRITRCKMYLPEMQKRMMSPRFGFSIVTEEQGRMQTESLPARKSGNMLNGICRVLLMLRIHSAVSFCCLRRMYAKNCKAAPYSKAYSKNIWLSRQAL